MTSPERLFARMWAAAALAHLAGNPFYGAVWPHPTTVGFVLLGVGVTAVTTLVRPARGTMLALVALVPLSAALEVPRLGNHWLLAGAVSLAYLVTRGRWELFTPAARWSLLVFYSFAAFAKLNRGFFDPTTSCAVFYADQALTAAGLPGLAPGSPQAWAAILGTILAETSIPVLLAAPPTRRVGVFLGIGFHGLVSLNLGQHFYDFTAVLLPLFVLFLADDDAEAAERTIASVPVYWRRLASAGIAAFGLLITGVHVTPYPASPWLLRRLTFLPWLLYLVFVAALAARARTAARPSWRLAPATAVIVTLVSVNGLTPYLELKTAFGFNMYANLVTANGGSNHLLVRRTLAVRRDQERPVEIIASSDQRLAAYATQGYLLPWPSFRAFLAAHRDISVTYRREAETLTLERASDRPDLVAPVPWWWRWMPLRALDARDPPRCQTTVLSAL